MSVLAVDIGGTKTLIALVEGTTVTDQAEIPTERSSGPESWVSQVANLAQKWSGKFDRAGIAVTGLVKDNHWYSLNKETLAISGRFALRDAACDTLGVPVTLCNDAQAAAWGEYVYGAGRDKDAVFLTISTGIGGGVVSNGHLLGGRSGLAGHFGQTAFLSEDSGTCFENSASGCWIASEGKKLGIAADARSVFAAAVDGNEAAENILQTSARRVGRLCHDLQLMFDPHVMIIGGGVGLATDYMQRIAASVEHCEQLVRPAFIHAALGKNAGVIGVADLSKRNQPNNKEAL